MKMGLLATLCVGVGWVVGVTISMVMMPIGGNLNYSFMEVMGNTLVFGFPGFVLFMISLILSFMNNANEGTYSSEF